MDGEKVGEKRRGGTWRDKQEDGEQSTTGLRAEEEVDEWRL